MEQRRRARTTTILARDDVDAVYIGTVHTTHADLAIRALEAGKAVLCEKPASPTADEVERILAAATRAERPFVEAFKTRFGPLAENLRAILASGELGAPERVEAAFGFAAGSRSGRLFDPALAGGAILDVGCYPVSLAVDVARAGGMPGPDDAVSSERRPALGIRRHRRGGRRARACRVRARRDRGRARDVDRAGASGIRGHPVREGHDRASGCLGRPRPRARPA